MRSSVVIDQQRRQSVQQWEKVVRDRKAICKAEPAGVWKAKQPQLKEQERYNRILPQIMLGRLRPRGTQVRRRCVATGRGRGIMRAFRRSRIMVRNRALRGELSCVRKMTW